VSTEITEVALEENINPMERDLKKKLLENKKMRKQELPIKSLEVDLEEEEVVTEVTKEKEVAIEEIEVATEVIETIEMIKKEKVEMLSIEINLMSIGLIRSIIKSMIRPSHI
jgi:hypothetical protein